MANKSEAISPYPHSNHTPKLHSSSSPSTSSSSTKLITQVIKTPPNIYSTLLKLASTRYSLSQHPSNKMATLNSSVLACKYSIAGAGSAELASKISSGVSPAGSSVKMPVIRAQVGNNKESGSIEGRRAAIGYFAATVLAVAASASAANAGVIDEYLEKSKANKELNDKKRLATSGANFARAFTVQFGSCKFPENFTGCQDLAKQKKVPFLSDDLAVECEGKDKYKCGSNVFWKW